MSQLSGLTDGLVFSRLLEDYSTEVHANALVAKSTTEAVVIMLWLVDVKYCELEQCKDDKQEPYLKFILIFLKKANVKGVIILQKEDSEYEKSE